MYSAVLMLALTAGSETADFGRHGCSGYASGCSTVVGSSFGCSGGGLFGNRNHGCRTTCTAYRAPVVLGCSGYASGCSRSHGGLFARRHGCSASTACCGPVVYGCSGSVAPGCGGTVVTPPVMKTMPKSSEPLPLPKKTQAAAPATILVSLPAGARLTVDGAATISTAAQRTLVTPALEVGADYSYTLRAEFVNEGRTQVQTQQVNVRGGETSTVQFNFATQGVASR